jgi:hypothetical protein
VGQEEKNGFEQESFLRVPGAIQQNLDQSVNARSEGAPGALKPVRCCLLLPVEIAQAVLEGNLPALK